MRKVYQDGLIFANVSACVSPKMAQQAIDMIDANILQIHLNAVQEAIIMMFLGASRVEDLHKKPVIITGETAEWLQRRNIDINMYAQRKG